MQHTVNNGHDKGPLRTIVAVLNAGYSSYDRDTVRFECGHTGRATRRAVRGRCAECKLLENNITRAT